MENFTPVRCLSPPNLTWKNSKFVESHHQPKATQQPSRLLCFANELSVLKVAYRVRKIINLKGAVHRVHQKTALVGLGNRRLPSLRTVLDLYTLEHPRIYDRGVQRRDAGRHGMCYADNAFPAAATPCGCRSGISHSDRSRKNLPSSRPRACGSGGRHPSRRVQGSRWSGPSCPLTAVA